MPNKFHKELEPFLRNATQKVYFADEMYQDELVVLLNSLTQPTWIAFKDAKKIADELLQVSQTPNDFLQKQFELIFGDPDSLEHFRKSLLEVNTFKTFLLQYGFVVEDKKIGVDGRTYLLISKPESANIPDISTMDATQLPKVTESFYRGKTSEKYAEQTILAKHMGIPLVLNIGSGGDASRKIPHAINGDLSSVGQPEVIFDARQLPFANDSMTLIMASHVFEHLTYSEAQEALAEWLRVLHPDGILRIAIPDGFSTLNELEEGQTRKGNAAYAFPGGSAPLTQLQGLGGEHSATHPRWRHQVLYTYELLESMINKTDRELVIREYSKEEALSTLSGVKLDETNSYSLMLEIRKRREAHNRSEEITLQEYEDKKSDFREKNVQGELPDLSIIIPVKNEAKNLPNFFVNVVANAQEVTSLGVEVEILFALNGCSDESEELIEAFIIENPQLKIKAVTTEKTILKAFIGGIKSREKDGYIAKIDVDTQSSHWMLSTLYMHMHSQKNIEVTYAEVLPNGDHPVMYNLAEWYQQFRSKRLYFHGRMSMYRTDPFSLFPEELVLSTQAQAEDVILSCMFIYYKGISSIQATPGAIVRSTSLQSYEKLYGNWQRARNEIKRICEVFPQFEVLKNILQRVPMEPDESLLQTDPGLFYIWQAYMHLHNSLGAAAKATDHIEYPLFSDTSVNDGWSLR